MKIMRTSLSTSSQLAAFAVLLCATSIQAHTWIDKLRLIGPNGAFTGLDGFMRGYVTRDSKEFTGELFTNRLTVINDAVLMCKQQGPDGDQGVGKQGKHPMLKAAPTDWVALIYADNGHVSLPQGTLRPAGNGTVYVYGTKNSLNSDTFKGIHQKWNAAGDGGDKRGKLLATRFYDDGQCHENSQTAIATARRATQDDVGTVDCQTDVQLPEDAGTDGLYTLYWVWDYALMTEDGQVRTPETYTSCMDISMTSQKTTNKIDFTPARGKGVTSVGIKAQIETAFMADPTMPPVLQIQKQFVANPPANGPNGPKGDAPAAPTPSLPVAPSSSSQPEASVTPPKKIPASPTSSAPTDAPKTVTVTATPTATTTVYMTGAVPPTGLPAPALNTLQTSKSASPDQPKQSPGGVFATTASSKPEASRGPIKPVVSPFLKAGQNYPRFIRAARAYHE